MSDLPLVIQFDEVCRRVDWLLRNDCTRQFLTFVKHQEQCRMKWKESVMECKRLKLELDDTVSKTSDFEKKLNRARVLVDTERKRAAKAEAERDELIGQVQQIKEILSCVQRAGDQLANETKEKLDKFLNTTEARLRASSELMGHRLNTIDEINSTALKNNLCSSSSSSHISGSLLSDVSYTRSEDDLDVSRKTSFKKLRRSLSPDTLQESMTVKKRRSSRHRKSSGGQIRKSGDHLVATTTVTVPKVGPVTACSKIETIPEMDREVYIPSAPPKSSSDSDTDVSELIKHPPAVSTPAPTPVPMRKLLSRPHCFRSKSMLKPSEECCVCTKKITFSKSYMYCIGCRVMTHPECKEKVLHPCIAVVDTPRRNVAATIADYCAKLPPMIPPLIVHCVWEVEARGLNEVGIYRVPGSELAVRTLKERILRGKGIYSLSTYDINVVCGTIKDFLRNLSEPLLTFALRSEFIRAAELADFTDATITFSPLVSQLPQPNKDTLVFLMQHLQKVAQSPGCKMSKSNLAMVFGPTLVGYAKPDNGRQVDMFVESEKTTQVVQCLLDLPEDFWYQNTFNEAARSDENCKETNGPGLATPIGSLGFRRMNRNRNIKMYTPPYK